jgi:DNA-binding transcriptional ArsR family regulator
VETTEVSFVDAVGRWSARSGVDRKTLSRIGVDRRTLDAAGLKATPVAELVRRQYQVEPLSVADLARRSGVSPASVHQTIYDDESDGLIEAVETEGRTVLYRLVR